MIALTRESVTATLPDRLIWTDEFAWSPVVTEPRYGTTGALQVHIGKRQAGRPITLDGRDSAAWITRAQCGQLNGWAALEGATFELVVRNTARTVLLLEFQADPIWKLLDGEHTPELLYVPFLKFMEI